MDLITIVTRDLVCERLQWLAERLADKERRVKMGAGRKYRNWKPR